HPLRRIDGPRGRREFIFDAAAEADQFEYFADSRPVSPRKLFGAYRRPKECPVRHPLTRHIQHQGEFQMSNSVHATQDPQPFGDITRRLVSVVDHANRRDPVLSEKLTVLADIQPTSIDWIWPRRIARGKLHILAGDPGLGKSFLTLDIASRITSGNAW